MDAPLLKNPDGTMQHMVCMTSIGFECYFESLARRHRGMTTPVRLVFRVQDTRLEQPRTWRREAKRKRAGERERKKERERERESTTIDMKWVTLTTNKTAFALMKMATKNMLFQSRRLRVRK